MLNKGSAILPKDLLLLLNIITIATTPASAKKLLRHARIKNQVHTVPLEIDASQSGSEGIFLI